MSVADWETETNAVIAALGRAVTYRKLAGGDDVSTYAIIDHVMLETGYESRAAEQSYEIVLKAADIAHPARGDLVIVSSTEMYEIGDLQESDGVEFRTTARRVT